MNYSQFSSSPGVMGGAARPSGGGGSPTSTSWMPSKAEERAYYDTLFQIADTSRTGRIAGQAAVSFFVRSGLPMDVLKQVWSIADHVPQSFLTRVEFYSAMRLIAMAQAQPGVPLSKERLVSENSNAYPVAKFKDAPPPPTSMISQGLPAMGAGAFPATAAGGGTGGDPYAISPPEKAKYEMLFPNYDTDKDGFISGAEAGAVFTKSGMDMQGLHQVWALSDVTGDHRLSCAEFCVAMHLIVCATKKGLSVPQVLPPSLAALVSHGGNTAASSTPQLLLGPPQPPLQVSSPPQQQQQQRPRPDISNAFEDLAAGGLGEPVSSQHSQSHAPPVAEATAALAATSLAFGATGGGGVSSPAPPAAQSSASLAGTVSGHSSTEFKSNDVVQELAASSEGLLEVTQSLVGQHAQGMAAQRASLDSMRKLIQRLQAEKVSLAAVLAGSAEEYEANQRELADLSTEVESLQADLSRLRMQRAEQERGHIGVRSDLEELRGRKGALRSQIDDEQMKLSLLADNRDDERRSLSPGMVSSRSNVEGLSTRAQPNQSEQGLSWGTLSSQASDTLSLPRSPTTVPPTVKTSFPSREGGPLSDNGSNSPAMQRRLGSPVDLMPEPEDAFSGSAPYMPPPEPAMPPTPPPKPIASPSQSSAADGPKPPVPPPKPTMAADTPPVAPLISSSDDPFADGGGFDGNEFAAFSSQGAGNAASADGIVPAFAAASAFSSQGDMAGFSADFEGDPFANEDPFAAAGGDPFASSTAADDDGFDAFQGAEAPTPNFGFGT